MTQTEYAILSTTYKLRALNFNQIDLHVLKDISQRRIQDILSDLCRRELLVKTGWKKEDAYYTLTNKGINLLRKEGMTCEKTAANLSFEPVYSAHQLALNDFVLSVIDIAVDGYTYYDEKFMSKILRNIRPDGVFVYEGIWYFLEMDMNTERARRLEKKWQSYRYFLNSNEYEQFTDRIRVLFILGGTGGTARKHQLWNLIIANLGDKLSDKFDILVANDNALINYMFKAKHKIPLCITAYKDRGYRVDSGVFDSGILESYPSDGYMVKEKDGEVVYDGEQRLEFIVDDFEFERISILNKIGAYDGIRAMLKCNYDVYLDYIIFARTDKQKEELKKYFNRIPEGIHIVSRGLPDVYSD